jgi:hypothetical protein
MTITHEQITQRAREIWEREGRPEGRDKEHWLQAEAELRNEGTKDLTGDQITSEDPALLKVPQSGGKENDLRKRGPRRNR